MTNTYDQPTRVTAQRTAVEPSLVTIAHVIYALHSLSILIGVTSAATIVGAFVFGLPSIVAVIINYVKRSEVRGTFLESHFRWQIRTFWFAALWATLGLLLWVALAVVLIGFLIGPIMLMITGLWVVYRVVRGWLALRDGRSILS
ncbi:MAG: hypothetical protein HY661_18495 [Betaproteobacteria bacterium]|nr:hypothetical protein [Betaproteobacteria bacterium]